MTIAESTRNESPLRVLVADAHEPDLKHLCGILELAGFEVFSATSGDEALRLVLTHAPSIVLADANIKGVEGELLCESLRTTDGIGFTYVIVLTQRDTAGAAIDAFEAGADDCIVKPVTERELQARLRAARRILDLYDDLQARKLQIFRQNAEMAIADGKLRKVNSRLAELATTDELTQLVNRREALSRLESYWAQCERYGWPLSCVVIDIDHFKPVNDSYGHDAGDHVLKETAAELRRLARKDETVARIGGEEFLIICPNSKLPGTAKAAERMRQAIENHVVVFRDRRFRLTISMGVAERTETMESPSDLLKSADDALYRAKNAGRNKVCAATKDAVVPSSTCGLQAGVQSNSAELDVDLVCVSAGERFRADWSAFSSHIKCNLSLKADADEILTMSTTDRSLLIVVDASEDGDLPGDLMARLLNWERETSNTIVVVQNERDDFLVRSLLELHGPEKFQFLHKHGNICQSISSISAERTTRQHLQDHMAWRSAHALAMTLLVDYCESLASAERLDDILGATFHLGLQLTCSGEVHMAVRQPDSGSFLLVQPESIPAGDLGRVIDISESMQLSFIRNSAPRFVEDVNHAEEKLRILLAQAGASSPAVVCPACCGGELLGVLCIGSKTVQTVGSDFEADYLGLACRMAASAIQNVFSHSALKAAQDSIVSGLAMLAEYRDVDTGDHLDRVTRYCLLLARQLFSSGHFLGQITDDFLSDLARAAQLHDIGKVAIADAILLKPGALTDEEMRIMRTHTTLGRNAIGDMIKRAPGANFLLVAEQIAHCHHERYDGKGYPQGLAGEAIPLAARIASVADVYDALTSRRVYKDAMPHEEAAGIIKSGAGTQFDPIVVAAFTAVERDFQRYSSRKARTHRVIAKSGSLPLPVAASG